MEKDQYFRSNCNFIINRSLFLLFLLKINKMDTSKILSFITEPIEEYIKVKFENFYLSAAEKISSILSRVLSSLLFVFCFICFFFFGSIAFALVISDLVGKHYFGFLVISLVYLLAGILFFIFRKKLFKKSLMNSIMGDLNHEPKN